MKTHNLILFTVLATLLACKAVDAQDFVGPVIEFYRVNPNFTVTVTQESRDKELVDVFMRNPVTGVSENMTGYFNAEGTLIGYGYTVQGLADRLGLPKNYTLRARYFNLAQLVNSDHRREQVNKIFWALQNPQRE